MAIYDERNLGTTGVRDYLQAVTKGQPQLKHNFSWIEPEEKRLYLLGYVEPGHPELGGVLARSKEILDWE